MPGGVSEHQRSSGKKAIAHKATARAVHTTPDGVPPETVLRKALVAGVRCSARPLLVSADHHRSFNGLWMVCGRRLFSDHGHGSIWPAASDPGLLRHDRPHQPDPAVCPCVVFAFHRSTCRRSISSISKRIAFPVARSSGLPLAERPAPQARSCSILLSSKRSVRGQSTRV